MARSRAYQVVDGISFAGMQCRRDIGHRAIDLRGAHHAPASPKT